MSLAYDTTAIALKQYGNAILRLAYSYMHNVTDAEDILQDTLMLYMEKQPELTSAAHEKAWLLRVAINLCKNKLKSAWFKRVELPETLSAEEVQSDAPEVLQSIASLPPKYREVIHLYYYEDYSTKQIAEILQKNEATVRSLLHRARAMLKEKLKGEYEFGE